MPPHLRLWLLAALVLTGCPKKPLDFGPQGEPRSALDLVRRLSFAEAQVLSLKGEAKLKITSTNGSGSAGLFVAVTHPSLIHLEVLDFFGRPQAVLTTDGAIFKLYDAQASKFITGPASPANMAKVVPIVMPPHELAALLLGRVPRIETADTSMRFIDATGRFELTLKGQGIEQIVEVEPPSYRAVSSRFTGVDAYALQFDDVQASPSGAAYPHRAKLSKTSVGTELELKFTDVELNPPADLTLFELEAPPNVPIVPVDAQGFER